jgi:putative ABC transport system permease protein
MEPRGEWITVIGVVGNVRHFGYESEMSPEMFVYHRQLDAWHESTLTALVRGEGESSALLASLSGAVRSVDPSIPADVALLDAAADRLTAPRRFTVRMLGLFGALALLLAALGVYGVLSFHVTRRTRELAVRTALGAQRRQLLRLVLRAALSTIGAGVVIGLAGLAGLSRLVESLLFGVEPLDVYALAIAATAVVVAALAAAWLPAMRATRVGTFQALKVD